MSIDANIPLLSFAVFEDDLAKSQFTLFETIVNLRCEGFSDLAIDDSFLGVFEIVIRFSRSEKLRDW